MDDQAFGLNGPQAKRPLRVEMLSEGIKLTAGSRDEEYGDPLINMSCAGELKAVIRKWAAREISPAEQEALDMVITKLSRAVTGKPKGDTYVDGATYFAIAGEMALRAKDDRPVISSDHQPLRHDPK